jgi:hypothetical protein
VLAKGPRSPIATVSNISQEIIVTDHPRTPKVTVHENTPTQQAIAKAAKTFEVTDARGRRFTLRKPGVLAQYRLVETLGESAENKVYMGMVLPLIYVSAIDGQPEALPMTKMEVEVLITRLDEDGINAVMAGVQEHFGATSAQEDQTAAKN